MPFVKAGSPKQKTASKYLVLPFAFCQGMPPKQKTGSKHLLFPFAFCQGFPSKKTLQQLFFLSLLFPFAFCQGRLLKKKTSASLSLFCHHFFNDQKVIISAFAIFVMAIASSKNMSCQKPTLLARAWQQST